MKRKSSRAIFKIGYLYLRRVFLIYTMSLFLSKKEVSFSMRNIKKILIIRIDGIGDLVLSTPALRAIREEFPQANITLVLNSNAQDLFKGIPWIDRIIVYRNLIQMAKILRQENFDLAIDLLMDYLLKSAFLVFLSSARYKLGYNIQGRGVFFNIRIEPTWAEKHIIERTLDVLRAIGVDTENRIPKILISDEQKNFTEEFLNQQKISKDDLLIGIHPGGRYLTQRWLLERFAQVADRIIAEYRIKVIIIGAPDEEKLICKVASLIKKQVVEAIGVSLGRLSALIARCNLFVCNNSGLLHIATAVSTPTVSTMGPTIPYLWWPQGENHIVVRKDLPCSPCNSGLCKSRQCMELITVEDMMEAVKIQLKRII